MSILTEQEINDFDTSKYDHAEISKRDLIRAIEAAVIEKKQPELDQLRADNERLNKQINSYKMLTKSLEETKTYLLKKAEQNKEAVETLTSEREANAALTGENERLKAELAEAKKDAERYRWLRHSSVGPSQIWELLSDDCQPPIMTLKSMHELDAAIDEAMKGK